MAPKKKPGKTDGEPDIFEEFLKKYGKNQKEFDTPKIQEVQDIINKVQEEGEDVIAWNFSREFDPMSFRVLWNTLRQVGLNTIKAIRIWKCNGGDESVRSVCQYLDSNPPPAVEDLQFTDNGLTALGCEFLGRTLGPTGNKVVNLLRLDYNLIGTAGIQKLSVGLTQNATLRHLSLQYCGIGEDGGEHVAHILMFIRCAIERLELRGNYLGNKGVISIFQGARRSKNLRAIDVFDNKFADSPEVIEALRDLFANNTKLESYKLGGNQMSDAGVRQLIQGMVGHSHLKEVFVPERCKEENIEALFQLTQAKKGKKGKKGKKK
mmetsp:Transcript_5842/g.13931  ORF Transcript_5842/g.13931 Transcript_5842/m.13931 type:complete len:321 (+) Transcript_5842:89-1051(+)